MAELDEIQALVAEGQEQGVLAWEVVGAAVEDLDLKPGRAAVAPTRLTRIDAGGLCRQTLGERGKRAVIVRLEKKLAGAEPGDEYVRLGGGRAAPGIDPRWRSNVLGPQPLGRPRTFQPETRGGIGDVQAQRAHAVRPGRWRRLPGS